MRTSSIICVDVAWKQIVEKLHKSHIIFYITFRPKQIKWTARMARKQEMRSDLNIIRTWRKNAVGRHRSRKDIRMNFFLSWLNNRSGHVPPLWSSSVTIRRTTLDRTLLDKWSDRRRYFYLTTHNNHKTETSMLPAGFKPEIPASGRR